MINAIFWSILESPPTSDYDDMDNSVYKSTVLEPTIKHLIKETSLCSQALRNLVKRGQNIISEIPLMKNDMRQIRGRSRCNTIKI